MAEQHKDRNLEFYWFFCIVLMVWPCGTNDMEVLYQLEILGREALTFLSDLSILSESLLRSHPKAKEICWRMQPVGYSSLQENFLRIRGEAPK